MSSLSPIYLVGPTGVGKSDVAAEVAARLGGEVVGADAFQIYRGLDLLTAKPDATTLARAPHYLVGEVPLSETFDVARYRALAVKRLAEIAARGRVAVIAGGTGLYVRALTHGLAEMPGPDAALRVQLEARPLVDLVAELQQLDPVGAAAMDLQNPRRVVRAVEVCRLTGRPFSSFREQESPAQPVRGVLLTRDRAELCVRIDRRTEQMFAAGVVEEVRAASEVSPTAAQAIGFGEIRALLRGESTTSECIVRIQQQTRQYAKRQLTWFRRETHFTPLVIAEGEALKTTTDHVLALLGS